MASEPPIRFAALRRVSTEQQQKTGESLRTQTTQINLAVKAVGGSVIEWYGGQEHATPGHEKKEIERLLNDATKHARPFDAVIVTHPDRWSRDNKASQQGLDVLKKNRVRFFVLSQEHDLYDPNAEMFLGMSAVIGGYQAKIQKKKSLESRIHRAKRGIPTCGNLPFGRTFNAVAGTWGVDEKKKTLIEKVAHRYLRGESMQVLAEEIGMNHSALHKIVTRGAGTKWTLTFNSEDLNIHQTVEMTIPELLPPAIIKKISAKVAANKTYEHGQPAKHKYLLSRMILCEECGYAYFGQTNHNGRRYYRHAHDKKLNEKCGVKRGWISADELEDAVLRHLFYTFGNPSAVEQAIEDAMPDLDAHRQHQQRLAELDELIQKEAEGRKKVIALVASGKCSDKEAEDALEGSRAKLTRLEAERVDLDTKTSHIPTANEVRAIAKQFSSSLRRASPALVKMNAKVGVDYGDFEKLTWKEKYALLQRVCGGICDDGRRAGVHIEWPRGKAGQCRYTIRGLMTRTANLPMTKTTKEYLVSPDNMQLGEHVGTVTKYAWPMCRTRRRR